MCMIVAITTSEDIAGTRIQETVLDKGIADHDTPKIEPTSLPTSSGMEDSSDIKQSLKEVLDKLSKLDDITEQLKTMGQDLKNTNDKCNDAYNIAKETECKQKLNSQEVKALKIEISELQQYKSRIIKIETQERMNNLICDRIKPSTSLHGRENCTELVMNMLVSKLGIKSDICIIERAHRYGPIIQDKPRPVMVRFYNWQ